MSLRPKTCVRRILSTLCSKRLKPTDYVDLSGRSRVNVTLPCGPTFLGYPKINVAGHFPPNTRGFFYYYTPPKAPPLVGELRFRCASNLDDFHNGKDLVLKDKFTPWSIPLYALANHVSYAKWREQLILDNLVTQATLDKWVTAKNTARDILKRDVGQDWPVLYYITQPFILRFNRVAFSFYAATKDEIGAFCVNNPFRDNRSSKSPFPYGGESSWIRIYMSSRNFRAGRGLVRFEPSVNPKRPEQDQVALRVLKIIEPVKTLVEDYDGYLHQPTEGMLIQRSNMAHPVPRLRLQTLKAAATLPLNFDDLP